MCNFSFTKDKILHFVCIHSLDFQHVLLNCLKCIFISVITCNHRLYFVNCVSVIDLHSCWAVSTQLPLARENVPVRFFIDDRSLDLALFPVAEKHMRTYLCPC